MQRYRAIETSETPKSMFAWGYIRLSGPEYEQRWGIAPYIEGGIASAASIVARGFRRRSMRYVC